MQKVPVNPIEVGKRLRNLRGIRTRVGAAREMGIGCSSLEAYETGLRNPSERVKDIIASYYGVSKESIFYANE